MTYLAQSMIYLPSNLQNLEIHLCQNNLGENEEYIMTLMECMKQFPYNLNNLKLDLNYN